MILKIPPPPLFSCSRFFVFCVAVFAFQMAMPSHAGFSISVQTIKPLVSTPAVGKPRLVLSKGMSLKSVISSFVHQYGWSVGWTATDVIVDEAQVFSGVDHEEVLVAVLRRYSLVADRYPADKGYMIQSSSTNSNDGAPK